MSGGSSASSLAKAWMHADRTNFARLKVAFPELWDEYDELLRRRGARADK